MAIDKSRKQVGQPNLENELRGAEQSKRWPRFPIVDVDPVHPEEGHAWILRSGGYSLRVFIDGGVRTVTLV